MNTEGHQIKAGNLRTPSFYRLLDRRELNFALDWELPGTVSEVRFVLLGDEGYALLPYLMGCTQAKPGHQNYIFNFRLSRAERSIDYACGIMCAKWKSLLNTLKHMSSMQPKLSKLYASFVILCCNIVDLTQFPQGQSKFSWPAQHCFSIVPRASVKNFWTPLPVWDLCHVKMIMLCLKMFNSTTLTICLTY